ncbi:MAG: alkaline phosphatase [Planctomycetota bacterium]
MTTSALLVLLVVGNDACLAQVAETAPWHGSAAAGLGVLAIDDMKQMQRLSATSQRPVYGHWGMNQDAYSSWTQHSNRLIPVYTFGISLSRLREQGSVYTDTDRLETLDGTPGTNSVHPNAIFYDQTDIYQLQQAAVDAGYSNIILMVFDGMDWETTQAAAIYKTGRVPYESGRGRGLAFQDDLRTRTDFGFVCTSAAASGAKTDVNAQTVLQTNNGARRGFDLKLGGRYPWTPNQNGSYLLGLHAEVTHTVTDSAASASSLCSGIKTYNGAINVKLDGTHVLPIARELQRDQSYMVGVVTSVPVSHATPAAAYANNVSRKDYQDIARDLIGLPSSAHREQPLAGVDVLIGGGWGESKDADDAQGDNFRQGNPYLHQDDIRTVSLPQGGSYRVVQRTEGVSGKKALMDAAQTAADNQERLLGLYGVKGGHLPYSTADGRFDPTLDVTGSTKYSEADIEENPTLADMTRAALLVLEQSIDGFWLMIETGDVDWANHANNLDNSIGAVLDGEAAFEAVMDWVDENNAWEYTAVIVTSDHGHYLVLDHPERVAEAGRKSRAKTSP